MFRFILLLCFVLCLNSTNGCRNGQLLKSGGLSPLEKQEIVDIHNRLRQSVARGEISKQPPAANMMEMKWDDELAARAQAWADQCIPTHDAATQRNVGRFSVGQNIAATWTNKSPITTKDSQPNFTKQIVDWFDENRQYGFRPMAYGSQQTGHYSQMVWSETSHIGCGFSYYYSPSHGYTKLYVCNYGPGGNVLGASPYQKGYPSCNSYGLSESSKYNGLCSIEFSSSYNSISLVNSKYEENIIPDSTYEGSENYNYYQSNNYYNHESNKYKSMITNVNQNTDVTYNINDEHKQEGLDEINVHSWTSQGNAGDTPVLNTMEGVRSNNAKQFTRMSQTSDKFGNFYKQETQHRITKNNNRFTFTQRAQPSNSHTTRRPFPSILNKPFRSTSSSIQNTNRKNLFSRAKSGFKFGSLY